MSGPYARIQGTKGRLIIWGSLVIAKPGGGLINVRVGHRSEIVERRAGPDHRMRNSVSVTFSDGVTSRPWVRATKRTPYAEP
jgi:hypothetical protein